uniref:Uncharacterized protein n=1 Tax=Anguilla anguilla TaxID=7936 RepID=A0A0E9W8P4_ANGAN
MTDSHSPSRRYVSGRVPTLAVQAWKTVSETILTRLDSTSNNAKSKYLETN